MMRVPLPRTRVLRAGAWATLLAAAVWLAWRGAWRGLLGPSDLAVRYHAAREWLTGGDPYAFAEGFGLDAQSLAVDPPGTIVAFVPLVLASWDAARAIGVVVSVMAILFIAVGVVRLAGWQPRSSKALLIVAFLIAFAPTITTIAGGQTGLVATAALVAAMLLERSGRRTLSGAVYGLAFVLKVTVGLPFILYLLWRRRWSPFLASLGVIAGFTAVAVIRMEWAQVRWLEPWMSNVATASQPGSINDPSPLNAGALSLVHLQYPLSAVLSDGLLVTGTSTAAVAVAALVFVWLHRGRDATPDLLALAVVTVLGILATYHRLYDVVMLAIPIAWACSIISSPMWPFGALVLGLSLAFLAPLQSLLGGRHGDLTTFLPAWLVDSPVWDALVVPIHSWVLVAMAIVLIVAGSRERELER